MCFSALALAALAQVAIYFVAFNGALSAHFLQTSINVSKINAVVNMPPAVQDKNAAQWLQAVAFGFSASFQGCQACGVIIKISDNRRAVDI